MVEYFRALNGLTQVATEGQIFLADDPERTRVEASLANQSSLMARRFRETTQETETSIKHELALELLAALDE
eukprot:1944756-Heterocapsa_arctica.AAC.1